jgi:cohesin loading factor subunit SCC2
MDFCRQSDYILKILLDGVTSEQITVRSRSLKSVDKMLEGDPSVLDRARNVKFLITNCATDASSMVRESALTLIGKCITLRPALEHEFLRQILKLTDDPAAGIRKRSIKLLKDIYLRNSDDSVKTVIVDSLLQRVKDLDIGVSDLARLTCEEVWLSPFWNTPDLAEASAQHKVDSRRQTSLIVSTVRRGEEVALLLVQLLKEVLSNSSKNAAANFKVCKSLVATAFDIIIDNFQNAERLEQRHILQTLTVFAAANAKLFTPDQVQSLQPYIANLSNKDDLEMFRSIVIIFRCVLPALSNVQHGLLREIQTALLQSIAKLGKAELNEVAECLWTINGTLQNPQMLLKLMISVLKNLYNMREMTLPDSNQGDDIKRVKKYIQIAGYFGKHCDFESHSQSFQNSLTWWKGRSVAGLIVDSIDPFTAIAQPLSLRAQAFDSVGLVCQSWPYQFTQESISNGFQDVLRKGEPELQTIVLSNFRDFFARIDRQAEAKGAESVEAINATSGERLGGSMTANDGDGASALIAQRFLKDILSIAIASQDSSALTATEVIASINRQGLVHPKESGPALVALETSTNPAIAAIAFQEHRLLHQQHESMFEREYMRAIQEAFRYQKDVVGDTLGYTARPYTSKLSAMFEIIKTSKGKYQKKFLSNFCSKVNCDISKMGLPGAAANALQFSRFLIENLAFFDYGRLDESLHTIACMEKIVADNGSGIAHSISTEIFNITVESMPEASVPGASQDQGSAVVSKPMIDSVRLTQLTTASIILGSLWESRTYLRRLYGLSAIQQRKENKAKPAAKDLSKTPSRVQGVNGDKFVASVADKVGSLASEEQMIQQCKDFVELLSVDAEVKVAAEGEEGSERPETPSDGEERDTPMSGGSKGTKRKASVSMAGTPTQKKKGRPILKRRKSGKSVGSDEDWD